MAPVKCAWCALILLFLGACDTAVDMSPFGVGSQLPNLDHLSGGGLLMSWVEPDADGHRLRLALYQKGQWQEPQTVASGDDWFVNWADFPSVRVIRPDLWAAHWLVRHGWNAYAYDVATSLSTDGGRTWSEPLIPHKDDTASEHGFVSLFPLAGEVGMVWLDGRETLGHTSGTEILGMTLRSAILNTEGDVVESLLDPLVCDCCQTDVAIGADGPLVVYRDRTRDEVRDVRLIRYSAGGWLASQPIGTDGWQVFGCPVNGPAVAAAGNFVAVAWYTEADERPRVQYVRSDDGGRTFAAPVRIDEGRPLGRVDVLIDDAGRGVVSWIERGDQTAATLQYRSVSATLHPGEPFTVTEISASHPSGFPRMELAGAGLLFAWTDFLQGETRVAVREVPLP